jgi:Na+-translocating ferredoxin:NAD+ oxidoreductase RNF subunit RnfB
MFIAILVPALAIGFLGLLFGLLLAYAAKKFHVEIDPKIEMVVDILPSSNCGACGLPGCISYAEAVVTKGIDTTLCSPGGAKVRRKIAEIMGKHTEAREKKIPVFHCTSGGYTNTNLKYSYDGIENCRAAILLANGPNMCDYGCLFQNDCITICKFNAIYLNNEGMRTKE